VVAAQHLLGRIRDQTDVFGGVNLHVDLVQRHLLHLARARADLDLHLAEPLAAGLDRDQDFAGDIRSRLRRIGAQRNARQQHADAGEVVRTDLDALAQGGFEGHEVARHFIAQHAHVGGGALVLRAEEAALDQRPPRDRLVLVSRRQNARVDGARVEAHLLLQDAHGHRAHHGGEGLRDALVVAHRQPVA